MCLSSEGGLGHVEEVYRGGGACRGGAAAGRADRPAALLLGGQTARAQFGYYAYLYLSDGYDFAVQAYLDTGDPDAYDAAVYAYYAQYFASVGEYYYAYVYGSYASDFAISAYDETGDPDAYDAYVYLAYGAVYAYYAYLGY